MINKNLLKAVLIAASTEAKNAVLEELLNHISCNYDYNDERAGHVVACLMDKSEIVTVDRINVKWLQTNVGQLIYDHDKYNVKDICPLNIDNIDCVVKVGFKVIEKINEDRGDVSYRDTYVNISFIDNPQILK